MRFINLGDKTLHTHTVIHHLSFRWSLSVRTEFFIMIYNFYNGLFYNIK